VGPREGRPPLLQSCPGRFAISPRYAALLTDPRAALFRTQGLVRSRIANFSFNSFVLCLRLTAVARRAVDMLDALDRKRGKGPEVVRVERVVVNEGGQAIVGNVQPAVSKVKKG
jgi:hypothetical protein